MKADLPIVLALTGASGVIYGQRLLEVLLRRGLAVHLTISESARQVLAHELGLSVQLGAFQTAQLLPAWPANATQPVYHHYQDFHTPIASGSFRTRGMVVCPCSGSTLSGIARGASDNLIQRAAEVHLKERRPLILVPRETPLSLIHIDNLRAVTLAGGMILPAAPGFYSRTETLQDLVDFVVARILDQLEVPQDLIPPWKKD